MIRVYLTNKNQRARFEHDGGPLEFGRGPKRDLARCTLQDPYVSKDHVRVDELGDGQLRVENLSTRNDILLSDQTVIAPATSRVIVVPARLTVGETLIDFELGPSQTDRAEAGPLRTIEQPVRSVAAEAPRLSDLAAGGKPVTTERLTQWFETVVSVQRAAASSPAFYDQTARAVVDLVGLDSGLVLLREGEAWKIAAQHGCEASPGTAFSANIMRRVVAERRTFFQAIGSETSYASLADVMAVVASPILDASGDQVIGVVYGSRFSSSGGRFEIQPLEAQLVQVLAAAVGAGLARMESEAEATRRHVQFEQFFSPVLLRELDRDPGLLEGRDRDVTVLFSDIRGFSRLSERIGPQETCRLIRDIMERLTVRVREHDGVVVDYIGDGLLAMWNAPIDQPDHATLACRAALAMLGELPAINAAWQGAIGHELGLGVGINTGRAMVGNTGSLYKFKYGPLGHTVNLASRVEGATKELGVPALITGSTRAGLAAPFATRRLCRVRVVGIASPVDLYELHAAAETPEWAAKREAYEQALVLYESARWAEVPRATYPLLAGQAGRYDIPSLKLLARAIDCLTAPPDDFDPVLQLASK